MLIIKMGVFDIIAILLFIGIIGVGIYFASSFNLLKSINVFGWKVNEVEEGQPCKADIECKDPLGCDYKDFTKEKGWSKTGDKICVKKVPDWKGIPYNPSVCQGAPSPLGNPGDCVFKYHWPREEGEPCDSNSACKGFVALQKGLGCDPVKKQCLQMKKDWAGVYYNESECKGGVFSAPGTCS